MKPYPEEVTQKALALHDKGWSYCAIGRELGVSHQTVRRWVLPGERERHNAVRQSLCDKKRKQWRDNQEQAAKVLYANSFNMELTARLLGVCRQTVRRWVLPGAREKHNKRIREYHQKHYQSVGPDPSKGRCKQDVVGADERIAKHRARILRGESA